MVRPGCNVLYKFWIVRCGDINSTLNTVLWAGHRFWVELFPGQIGVTTIKLC